MEIKYKEIKSVTREKRDELERGQQLGYVIGEDSKVKRIEKRWRRLN